MSAERDRLSLPAAATGGRNASRYPWRGAEHGAEQFLRGMIVAGERADGVIGADPADLVRVDPGQERGQAGQAGQLIAAVPAGGQVGIDQPALGGVDGTQYVDAKRWPGLGAIPCLLCHGASPRSCSASLSAFSA